MRKLALQLESIHVDSFATTSLVRGEGTVAGFDCEYGAFSDIKPASEDCKTRDCASNQATCDTCQGPNCRGGVPA